MKTSVDPSVAQNYRPLHLLRYCLHEFLPTCAFFLGSDTKKSPERAIPLFLLAMDIPVPVHSVKHCWQKITAVMSKCQWQTSAWTGSRAAVFCVLLWLLEECTWGQFTKHEGFIWMPMWTAYQTGWDLHLRHKNQYKHTDSCTFPYLFCMYCLNIPSLLLDKCVWKGVNDSNLRWRCSMRWPQLPCRSYRIINKDNYSQQRSVGVKHALIKKDFGNTLLRYLHNAL